MKPLVQLSAVLIAMFAMTQADSNSARAAELKRAHNQLTHALRYSEAIANDRSIEDIEARSKRLAAVTAEQVRQGART